MLTAEIPPVDILPARSAGGSSKPRRTLPWLLILTVAVTVAGIVVRLCHWAAFKGMGFDEALYRHYLGQLIRVGLGHYPDIVDSYLDYQKTIPGSILPPTRFL